MKPEKKDKLFNVLRWIAYILATIAGGAGAYSVADSMNLL